MAENPFDRTNPTMRDCWDAGHAAGVAAERERCAKVVENRAGADAYADDNRPCGPCCTLNAAAIRATPEQPR